MVFIRRQFLKTSILQIVNSQKKLNEPSGDLVNQQNNSSNNKNCSLIKKQQIIGIIDFLKLKISDKTDLKWGITGHLTSKCQIAYVNNVNSNKVL